MESDGGERVAQLDAGSRSDGGPPCPSPQDEEELLRRWNDAAMGITLTGFRDFTWTSPDQFPHPTYRGGSAEAYTKAATVVTRLLSRSGTPEYLEERCLLDRRWGLELGSATISLRQFSLSLCTSSLVGASERAALCAACRPMGC